VLNGLRPGGAGTGVDGGLLAGLGRLGLRVLALGLVWRLSLRLFLRLRLMCLRQGYAAGLADTGTCVRLMRYGLLVRLSLLGERLSGGGLSDGLLGGDCLLWDGACGAGACGAGA
jgi:hypothetical protein